MIRYIAILRGINVGGHKKILMADLKQLFVELKFENPVTYIQSGNVVFGAENGLKPSEIITRIEMAIKESYGFEVPVILRDQAEMNIIFKSNPYLKSDESNLNQLYLCFLDKNPDQEGIAKLAAFDFQKDVYQIDGKELFICYEDMVRTSKLSHTIIESKLKVKATVRNWKTTKKIHELIND